MEKLDTLHADPSKAGSKPFHYDADHERRRKEQLVRLYNRTPEEVFIKRCLIFPMITKS